MEQHADPRRLENDCIAHDESRDQRREGFVEGIVKRSHAQDNTERSTSDLANNALGDGKA